jgi:hypothetical protein
MMNPTGESNGGALRLDFDRRLKLQFHGSVVTSDAGLLAYRELDDALGLSDLASEVLADARTGKNGRHGLAGLFRQSVFGRLAGYEDVNDAERLRHDPAMRWVVGGRAALSGAASPSQMGRFETRWLSYQAGTWTKPRRLVVKVEWHPGELYPRVGFIVTNLARPPENFVAFYNKFGTCGHYVKEAKGAIK